MISREVNSLSRINHPSFVKFFGYSPVDFDNKPFPILVMELYSNYSLSKLINSMRKGQKFIEWNDTKKLINIYRIAADFREPILDCYRELIEKCWSHEPKDRPTFDEIVNILRTDQRFITETIDITEYHNYIKYIDETQSAFGYHPHNHKVKDFLKINFQSFNKTNIFLQLNESKNTKILSIDLKCIDLNKFEKLNQIGQGGFGTVYKVISKNTGKKYAAKISMSNLDQCNDDTIKDLEREININSELNHPSILKFIGFNSNNFKSKPKPTIITELASNGSLDKIIKLERISCGNPNWNDTKKLITIYGIASGMSYLNKHDILHRDLKPANILLDDYLFPKISDFGLSKKLYIGKEATFSGFKRTCAYSAPEVFGGKYSKEGDVYSFSIIVY